MDGKACVLLLVPPGSLGGINLLSFTTTDRFKGIKELPPGWHFVFTSSTTSLSIRHGAWFRVQGGDGSDSDSTAPPELFIKKWDAQAEELVEESSETERLRWRANLGALWREGLTPYRQSATTSRSNAADDGDDDDAVTEDRAHDWRALTDCLSARLLSRITGGAEADHWSLTSASSAARDMDEIPGLGRERSMFQPERELAFLPVDLRQTWREGATGRERTEAAQDRSWALGDLVERCCGGAEEEVLGELQFAFLMVLTLNNNSCLEQWKRLVAMLLTCKRAAAQRSALYVRLLRLLRLQLQHCQDAEGGLFDLSEDGGAFLKALLRRFKKGLEELEGGQGKADVADELDELEDFVRREYGWQLDDAFVVRRGMLELEDGERVEMDVGAAFDEDDETGEFAPTVVELTDEQARSLGGAAGEAQEHEKKLLKPDSGIADVEVEEESEDDAELEDMDARY